MAPAARAGGLYTPEILGSAASLAAYPFDPGHAHIGEARSRSCGSTMRLSLALDPAGCITQVGVLPHACAVGQAAASLFVAHATGCNSNEIVAAREALARWLSGEGGEPDWPGIALLTPALDFPARHPAILLAWDAALAAMTPRTNS